MKTYSIAQISRETKIPDSTLRYYARNFEDFVPVENGEGKAKRYSEEAVTVLTTIKELFDQGLKGPEVSEQLSSQFTRTVKLEYDEDGEIHGEKGNQLAKYSGGIVPLLEQFIDSQDKLTKAFHEQTEVQKQTLNVVEKQADVLDNTTVLLKEIRNELTAVDENKKLKSKLDVAINRNEKMVKQREHLISEIDRPLSLKERLTGKRERNNNNSSTTKHQGNKKATAQT